MREPISIPLPLQRRILAKNEAFARAKRELEELLELTQELLEGPEGYVLQDVIQGGVPLEMLTGEGQTVDDQATRTQGDAGDEQVG
jgi:hypothetical protein